MKKQRFWLLWGAFFFLSALPARSQPPTPANRPILRVQSQGSEVSEVQSALKLLGYYSGVIDGIYGESTVIAVYRFQQAARLNATGIVDGATWATLFPALAQPSPSPAPPTNPQAALDSRPLLKLGASGPDVTLLQQRLNALGFPIAIDRVFGQETLRAVIALQRKFKLAPDGLVGPTTWRVLLSQP